jgi:hypothetical protein
MDLTLEHIIITCFLKTNVNLINRVTQVLWKTLWFADDLYIMLQTWKLREEERLLDIVDPELTEYPEDELMRFIKVALFCTQRSASQRPTMKQVVDMLSKEVNLNEKALTKPGVYRVNTFSKDGAGTSSGETSSRAVKRNQQANPRVDSNDSFNSDSGSMILPR